MLTGGTEYQTINLVRALKAAGHKVITSCYYEYQPDMVALFESYGAEVILFSPENQQLRPNGFKQVLFIIKKFREVVNKYNPDLVHVQYMAPGALPVFAARLAGVKKVLATVHQPYTQSHGLFSKMMLRFSAWFCSAFIVVSRNAETSWFGSATFFNENKPLSAQPKHFTIYNAIDITRIQELIRMVNVVKQKDANHIQPTAFVFGAVSRLRQEKGIDLLIEAFSRLAAQNPKVHLHLVGSGPDELKLKAQIQQLNLTHQVTFFGEASWETAMQQLALMDVVVVPSQFEGFGLSAAEAMAAGKPLIASDVFGLKEVANFGKAGLLFKSGSVDDLYLKLVAMYDNESMRHNYQLQAALWVNQFSMDQFSHKIKILHQIS